MSDKKAIKKRNWGFIMYPESAPDDWKSILEKSGLKIAVSPLHDKDVFSDEDEKRNPDNKAGSLKKSHYHVLLHFDGPTTFNVAASISSSVCASLPVAVESLRGSYDYLSHENNSDKAQYNRDDIVLLNGFRIESLTELSSDDIVRLTISIQELIIDNDILEYSDLIDVLLKNIDLLRPEYRLATSRTIFFKGYIDSRRHKSKKNFKK